MAKIRIKFSKNMARQLPEPKQSFPTRNIAYLFGIQKYGSGTFMEFGNGIIGGWAVIGGKTKHKFNPEGFGSWVAVGKGKGWHEPPAEIDGKAPIHKEVAERAQAKHAQNTPMKKAHRKLTEKERDRMIDLHASAPLTYRPKTDDKLIKLGLVQFWDNTPDAVENTSAPFYDRSGRILPEWYDFKAETPFNKWVQHLKSLDRNGKGFEVFDSSAEDESVDVLDKILRGGQEALDEYINTLQEHNFEYTYEMFSNSFNEFLKDEGIDKDHIENTDEFRIEFENHLNFNIGKFFDYHVLLLEKKQYEVAYDGASSEIDDSDTEGKEFRKKALKYITEKQFSTILANSDGGAGYFGIIIHASEIIEAIQKGEKSVSDNQLVVGIHDWMNGAGYFERATVKPNYEISLNNAELDSGNYGIGGVFGTSEWNWR